MFDTILNFISECLYYERKIIGEITDFTNQSDEDHYSNFESDKLDNHSAIVQFPNLFSQTQQNTIDLESEIDFTFFQAEIIRLYKKILLNNNANNNTNNNNNNNNNNMNNSGNNNLNNINSDDFEIYYVIPNNNINTNMNINNNNIISIENMEKIYDNDSYNKAINSLEKMDHSYNLQIFVYNSTLSNINNINNNNLKKNWVPSARPTRNLSSSNFLKTKSTSDSSIPQTHSIISTSPTSPLSTYSSSDNFRNSFELNSPLSLVNNNNNDNNINDNNINDRENKNDNNNDSKNDNNDNDNDNNNGILLVKSNFWEATWRSVSFHFDGNNLIELNNNNNNNNNINININVSEYAKVNVSLIVGKQFCYYVYKINDNNNNDNNNNNYNDNNDNNNLSFLIRAETQSDFDFWAPLFVLFLFFLFIILYEYVF